MSLQASLLPCSLHCVRNLAILRIKDKLLTFARIVWLLSILLSFSELHKPLEKTRNRKKILKNVCIILSPYVFQVYPHFYVENRKITELPWQTWNVKGIRAHISI